MDYTYVRMSDINPNAEIVQKITGERELVLQNIQQLEQNINVLTQQLNQAQQNLIASKGAVMGYERLLNAFSAPASAEASAPIPVEANN